MTEEGSQQQEKPPEENIAHALQFLHGGGEEIQKAQALALIAIAQYLDMILSRMANGE